MGRSLASPVITLAVCRKPSNLKMANEMKIEWHEAAVLSLHFDGVTCSFPAACKCTNFWWPFLYRWLQVPVAPSPTQFAYFPSCQDNLLASRPLKSLYRHTPIATGGEVTQWTYVVSLGSTWNSAERSGARPSSNSRVHPSSSVVLFPKMKGR